MRYAVVLVIGLLAGWFGHEFLKPPPPPRVERVATRPPEPPPHAPEPVSLPPAPSLPAPEGEVPAEGETPVETAAADPEMDALKEWLHSQSKAWKGWAGMQARQKAEALLARLPFDEERERKIQELLQKEAELQAEQAVAMMLGEAEMDPDAFAWFFGLAPELSPRLEGELATFLNDAEIQVLRAEVKTTYDKQMNDVADMQIGMMAISDLSDDQRTRLRDVFVGKDMMSEQMTRFAELTRDRDRFRRVLAGEGLKDEMERSFAPMRQRVRDILNDEQYRKYEAFEKQMERQAEIGIKMMGSFLEQQRGGTKAPASK
jgi:hypothetical protein